MGNIMCLFRDRELLRKLRFYLYEEAELPMAPGNLKEASVVIPFSYEKGEWVIYFILRSGGVKRHAHQMAFPGGSFEEGDQSALATGIRELEEEVGLSKRSIHIVGFEEPEITVTGFYIYPIIVEICNTWYPRIDSYEIEKLIRVPLRIFFDANMYSSQSRYWKGHFFKIHAFRYGTHVIWGATGRIMANVLRRLWYLWDEVPLYPLVLRTQIDRDRVYRELFVNS